MVFSRDGPEKPGKSLSTGAKSGIFRFSTVSTPPTTTTTTFILLSFLLPFFRQERKQHAQTYRAVALRDWTICFSDVAWRIMMERYTRVPRFRLPAPLRGSTPRQWLVFAFAVTPFCRSAQNDTVGVAYRKIYPIRCNVTLINTTMSDRATMPD